MHTRTPASLLALVPEPPLRTLPLLTPKRGTAAMLTVVATLLGANLFLGLLGVGGPDAAQAEQPKTVDVPFNAADQRKQMIDQLGQMQARLAAIESKLDKGLSVKVTEMPPVKVSSMPKGE